MRDRRPLGRWKNYQFGSPSLRLTSFFGTTRANLSDVIPPDTEYRFEFLWRELNELLPNDVPEAICGIDLPDHGELWTSSLDYQIESESLVVSGKLSRSGLEYQRTMALAKDEPRIDLQYRIKNTLNKPLPLLWKLHAALRIAEGDRVVCPAAKARPADLEYSRWTSDEPFDWPHVEGDRAEYRSTKV